MSASIQSIVATPLHAVAESNIALAHLNFDFSLVKYEAPVELQPLGKQLSKSRRQSAEDGSFHILARRLGVLFDDVLPEVPALLEAYGTRASEIVQETTQTLHSPKDIVDGFFGSHLGIDSTTIWASATSGKSVLRIHLLACMLARIWSPQEATAIWSELVTHRQAVIRSQAQSPEIVDNYLAQLAATHEIDGASLGSWDASARAWLQVADQARKKEQIQVQLIVNNLSVAVKSQAVSDHGSSPKINCYDSVLLNLNRALTTLEKLIKGEPQRITDGGILLGLTSWHLYPDLVVLGSTTKEIRQEDQLVKEGGIVTISIAAQASPRADGVYWSLPLASLRYYGTVQRERSTMHDSRISVEQLQALALGASLGSPEVPVTAAMILRSLWNLFHRIYQVRMCQLADKPPEPPEDLSRFSVVGLIEDTPESLRDLMRLLQLLFPLRDGIDLLLSDDSNERKTATQLMRYGANYGKLWIGNKSSSSSTFFGLATLQALLGMAKYPGARIRILRTLCAQYQLTSSDYVIRFRTQDNSWAYAPITAGHFEAAHGGMKRKRDEYESPDLEPTECLEIPPAENWICIATLAASSGHGPQSSTSSVYDDIFAELLEDNPQVGQSVLFDFAFGDHNLAAVYRRQTSQSSSQNQTFSSTVPLAMVQDLLDKNLLRLDTVAQSLLDHFGSIQPLHGDSLLALGRVVDYYKCYLPQATVSMGVIKSPVSSWTWVQSMVSALDISGPLAEQHAREGYVPESIYPSPLSREHILAAILQFESGTISVDTSDLAAVLAISTGNSLFIAEQLLHDPTFTGRISSGAVSHVIGNVGKPGIALLVSPPELEIREHDLERCRFVNHHPFDGSPIGGMFDSTSLHLSFTGWEGPVSLSSSSFRSMEAYYLETTVSVNDGGEWVGDVDILKGLRDAQMLVHPLSDITCSHDPCFTAAGAAMISIDCWEEILDPPGGILVLRSTPTTPGGSRNWQWMVRLAAVSMASLRNYQCICIPLDRSVCWTCVVGRLGVDRDRTLVVY
ncbi:hypothetical protein BO78DRAFT_339468 [Aspergillus sclerotiicarbonarius CBS 121057]|uniref:Uncharacterized protein n=1 Tax=Aspergillus sclerotiicarbonarius (strain CBS 121057 / IBT 28362) TaxID=1448318 RepID=A0A319FK09_ASPSB|nr:hypothetical protein BO78DRAFT_339468 [Aspergillus sclerotiicarbonarius CBS 121057]